MAPTPEVIVNDYLNDKQNGGPSQNVVDSTAPPAKETKTHKEIKLEERKNKKVDDTKVTIKLEHLDSFLEVKNAMKRSGQSERENNKRLSSMLADINVEHKGRSVSQYSTVKSATSGILNIGLLEKTVVDLKDLTEIGRDLEPYYDVIMTIYIINIIVTVFGILAGSYLAIRDSRATHKQSIHWLNNTIAFGASVLLVTGTISSALKASGDSHIQTLQNLRNQNLNITAIVS